MIVINAMVVERTRCVSFRIIILECLYLRIPIVSNTDILGDKYLPNIQYSRMNDSSLLYSRFMSDAWHACHYHLLLCSNSIALSLSLSYYCTQNYYWFHDVRLLFGSQIRTGKAGLFVLATLPREALKCVYSSRCADRVHQFPVDMIVQRMEKVTLVI